jgi:hypothetical protein
VRLAPPGRLNSRSRRGLMLVVSKACFDLCLMVKVVRIAGGRSFLFRGFLDFLTRFDFFLPDHCRTNYRCTQNPERTTDVKACGDRSDRNDRRRRSSDATGGAQKNESCEEEEETLFEVFHVLIVVLFCGEVILESCLQTWR